MKKLIYLVAIGFIASCSANTNNTEAEANDSETTEQEAEAQEEVQEEAPAEELSWTSSILGTWTY